MKVYIVGLCTIIIALISGLLLRNHSKPREVNENIEQFDILSHTMTIEEVDADCTLYRIDITSPEEPDDWADIDYNIKVKLHNVVLKELYQDTIIKMIREECPDDITSITVTF